MSNLECLKRRFLEANHAELLTAEATRFDQKFYGLNKAIVKVLEDYSLVQVMTLNIKQEDSLDQTLYAADALVQFGDSQEPQEEAYEHAENVLAPEPMI